MDLDSGRRRFLELTGTGLTVSLAGCNAPDPDGSVENGGTTVEETDDDLDAMATVTIALEIDSEALQAAQEDLVSQIENGTINQTEAQEELFATEAELLTEAASALDDRAAETESLSIEQRAPEIGVVKALGTPKTLIDLIDRPEVRGLFAAETFEEAIAQQQQASG